MDMKKEGRMVGMLVGWLVGCPDAQTEGLGGRYDSGTIIGTIGRDNSQCFLVFSDDACWKAGQGSALKMSVF